VTEQLDVRTVFTKEAQLGDGPDQPSYRSGELLIVKSESDGMVVCETIDGTEKILKADAIL